MAECSGDFISASCLFKVLGAFFCNFGRLDSIRSNGKLITLQICI